MREDDELQRTHCKKIIKKLRFLKKNREAKFLGKGVPTANQTFAHKLTDSHVLYDNNVFGVYAGGEM